MLETIIHKLGNISHEVTISDVWILIQNSKKGATTDYRLFGYNLFIFWTWKVCCKLWAILFSSKIHEFESNEAWFEMKC